MAHRALGAGFAGQVAVDVAIHLARLVEEILHKGVLGLVADEIELVPQPVQLLVATIVQDQLHQRGIVAVIAAGIVITGAEQPPRIHGVVGPEAAALADHEGVGEHAGEPREGFLVLGLLPGRIYEIGIADARVCGDHAPAWAGIFMQRRIFRHFHQMQRRFVVGAQHIGIGVAVMRAIFLQAPVVQRL